MNYPRPSVAIVILNWNGKHYLEKFLPSVLKSKYDNLRIIVADNNSNDVSIAFLKNTFPEVEIISLDKNYGFAGGYNRALAQIEATYYVLLNSDVEVTPGWIQPMVDLLESDYTIAACQPKIRSLKNREIFEYAGASGGWIDSLGYPFCRGRIFDTCEKDTGQYDDVLQVFWASGAAMFVRAAHFRSSGGFDEYLFAHQEEIDLCWRWQNEGNKIFVQPLSLVYHLGGGSLAQGNKKKVYLNFRNNLVVMHKNLSHSERKKIIFKRMLLDGVAGTRFLLQGKFSLVFAVLRAHRDYYRWARDSKPRPEPGIDQPCTHKELKTLQGVYTGSIVKDYFMNGKKFFSEIVKNKK